MPRSFKKSRKFYFIFFFLKYMSFGSCCILDGSRYYVMDEKSVIVQGEELGLLVNFEVTQTF